jgi:exopolysaccharide production protein ExoZ
VTHRPGAEAVLSLLFFPFPDEDGVMRPVLGQGWTLNFEMLFYAVFTLCLFLRGTGRYLALTAVIGLLVIAGPLGVLSASDHPVINALYLLSEPYLLYFLSGVWFCVTYARVGLSRRGTALTRS